ncbi:MAG: hypothetical protein HYY42_01200, partial [Chloroflexi bacterium]|nr:hypothetical protein [Chloroflexota bacterium]
VRDAIERARAEEAQTARLHEEFRRVRATDRGEDPEIKAMRDRHRATQETLKQERAALDEERRRLLSDIRDLNAKQAERWNAQVRKWDRYSQVASTIQKGADTSVSILGQYTGTPGKIVSGAYTFTKTVAGELAKGESFGAAVKAGSSELVLDLTAGKVQSKLGLEFKTPNLPNAPVGELLKEAAQTGARTVVVGAGKGIANFGLGEAIKYPFTKFADFFLGGK